MVLDEGGGSVSGPLPPLPHPASPSPAEPVSRCPLQHDCRPFPSDSTTTLEKREGMYRVSVRRQAACLLCSIALVDGKCPVLVSMHFHVI